MRIAFWRLPRSAKVDRNLEHLHYPLPFVPLDRFSMVCEQLQVIQRVLYRLCYESQHLRSLQQNAVIRPPQVDELLRRCSGASGKDKGLSLSGRAAWSLCLLLFSAKTATSPMYSALANQFDGKVAFGEVWSLNSRTKSKPCWPLNYSLFGITRPRTRLLFVVGSSQKMNNTGHAVNAVQLR